MKLFLLLANLSKEELKLVRKAVLSPLYNSNKKVVQLFELLRPKHPTFYTSQKAKERLFKKLYPTEGFHDYKWRRLCSELTKVIEQVMIHIDTMENDFARQKQLKQIFNKRGLYPLFKKKSSDLLAQLEAKPQRSAEFHREKMDLLAEQFFHHTHDKYDFQDDILEQSMERLDTYFALQKMRFAIAYKGKQQVLNKNNPIHFLEAIKKIKAEGFQKDNVLLELYIQAMDFSDKTSLVQFKQYEKNFFTRLKEFDGVDQKILFMAGINFVVKKKNNGVNTFNSFPFNWYRFGLSNDLVLDQKKLAEHAFANIIINGCHEKEFDWVENFMDNYKGYLNIDNIEETLLYYRGVVYYLKGDWDKSLDFLMRGANKDIYPLRSRSVIIRALFEKFLTDDSYLDILLSNIQAFEVYLRRETLFAEEKVNNYLNFLLISKLLAKKIHANERPQAIRNWFRNKTSNNASTLARSWFIEKVDNL